MSTEPHPTHRETDSLRCPRCGGPMEPGFIADRAHGATLQEIWVPGEPQKTFWGGVKIREPMLIETSRCCDCGYLESYALRESR